jgi:putative transposase
VVQSDAYLLACSRYIELNPVRARMVIRPEDYVWSNYLSRISNSVEHDWLDSDPCFQTLGQTAQERCRRYGEFVNQAIPVAGLKLIREALQRGQLTGSSRFVDEIEQIIGLRIKCHGQGRPRNMTEK